MKTNPKLNATIYEVLDNQIRENNPPETKQTLDRLISEGQSKDEARRLVACVITSEIFEVLKKHEVFNLERFIKALETLPEPWGTNPK